MFEDVEPAGWTVADGGYSRLRRLRREAEKAGGAAALERLRELNRAQLRAAGRFIAACRGCAGANDANRAELGTRPRNSDSDEDFEIIRSMKKKSATMKADATTYADHDDSFDD